MASGVSPWRLTGLLIARPGQSTAFAFCLRGSSCNNSAGQTTGVDLDFRVGIATDNKAVTYALGWRSAHVLDANYQGIYSNSQNPLSWTLAEPFNSARMNLEWSRGNFSTGIRGFYREPVNFLNRSSVDNLTTFDVHFTWKTPWKANLSVGASNILNAGAEETGNADIKPERSS